MGIASTFWGGTRGVWKVRSTVVFLSNRYTNPFMYGIILNSYLPSMSGHKFHLGYVAVYGQGAPCRGFL